MNKKLFTILFIIVSSLANILLTLLVIALLVAASFGVLHLFNAQPQAYGTAFFLCFLIGLAIAFFVYTKYSTKIINKFKLQTKFEDKWLDLDNKKKQQAAKKQTNMPSSVLPSEEELEEQEKWGK